MKRFKYYYKGSSSLPGDVKEKQFQFNRVCINNARSHKIVLHIYLCTQQKSLDVDPDVC